MAKAKARTKANSSKARLKVGRERTGVQTIYLVNQIAASSQAVLDKRLPATYETYRMIRKQPTVALARALVIAPVVAGDWSTKVTDDAPEDADRLIKDQLFPIREPLLTTTIEARVDYGWAGFEKVFERRVVDGRERTCFRKAKPLLVDLTDIEADSETGTFAGFRQLPSGGQADYTHLELPYSLLLNFGVEGANLYGENLLENVRLAYLNWLDCNDGAERYDRKVAGTNWVITYPGGGTTPVGGEDVLNDVIARQIVDNLEASGSVILPDVQEAIDGLPDATGGRWRVDLKDHTAKQYSFVARLGYLDKMFVRGVHFPERAVLEGQFGTKAEAGVHFDASLTIRELEHRHVTRLLNWHLVDQLLVENWGEAARGSVELVAAPLVDAKLTFFREVYKAVLANPVGYVDASRGLDLDGLMDDVDLPKLQADVTSPMAPEGMDVTYRLAGLLGELYKRANADVPSAVPTPAGEAA